ncbi:MAG: hypothetical protein EA415_12915 [Sphaerobacteraceae bacterium]|nr:MAG: hypothetical protein EA415_12915 [Sphaerobacteraceae bacterium]
MGSENLTQIGANQMETCELLAGTADGILRITVSATGEAEVVSRGLKGHAIRGIAQHPSKPDTFSIAAGLRGWGLHTTCDYGQTFTSLGFEHYRCWDIVVDPHDPRRMYVYVDSQQCPVYRSTDGGASWEPVGSGLPSSRPADPICRHPGSPGTLFYTGDYADGSTLYLSEDSGDSWHRIELELPEVWRLQETPEDRSHPEG